MYIEDRIARALYRRGYDLYTILTWRSRWDLCRPLAIQIGLVLLAAWGMRFVYFSAPAWFGGLH